MRWSLENFFVLTDAEGLVEESIAMESRHLNNIIFFCDYNYLENWLVAEVVEEKWNVLCHLNSRKKTL